ncbi:MAG: hypothetical protein H0W78_14135 [Planctomycetes bacterium]|nr:hypothetical protein [Planctomycetota bacterium]
MPAAHIWTFFRAGGLDQVLFQSADDFRNLRQLDQKLWVALTCPVKGLQFDSRTLELIDTDKDGRVRAPEVIATVEWACGLLTDPADLKKGVDGLPLAAINGSTDAGKALLASAKQVLINLGRPTASIVTVADISDTVKLFVDTTFNGDGVIIPEATDNAALKQTLLDIISIQGPVTDRSGKPGVDQAKSDAFFADCGALAGWLTASTSMQILGDATPAAHATFIAVKSKITDYFSRCRLAAYDHRAANALNRAEQDYLAIAAKDLSIANEEVVGLPLQRIEPRKSFNLTEAMNPAWSDRIAAFHQAVVVPLLGAEKKSITDAEWVDLCARFAPYETWLASKKGVAVEKLGANRVHAIVSANDQAAVNALIAKDLELKSQVAGFGDVERLVRCYRDLGALLRNFVNFADFYDLTKESIFQAGTLYLDQRACSLCIRVDDPAAHMPLGSLGKVYIAYCHLSRSSGEKMAIAACFTQGDGDYLMVGRNGLFYDRQGRDWDATITKIIDNPMSVRQAFWSPYKKFVRFVEEQVAKRAATADDAATTKLQGVATKTVDTAVIGKPPEKPKFEVGTVAALGVGLGAISTMIGGALTGFVGLGWWMPLGIIGMILLISGPSMLIAWIKLRQRTLGPILEGTGWAINGRVKINIPLGAYLTEAKELPPGAKRLLGDPFSDEKEKRRQRNRFILAAVVIVLAAAVWWQFDWLKGKWNEYRTPPAASDTTTTTTTTPTGTTTTTTTPASATTVPPTEPTKPVEAPKP